MGAVQGGAHISRHLDRVIRTQLDRLPAGLRPKLPKEERIVLIDNPYSGGGTYASHAHYAQQVYSFLGYDVELACTERAGHAAELARRAADAGATLVIACSGDGGVRETVLGLMSIEDPARRPKLSVIPKGTANVLAKTLGLQVGPFPDFFHACLKQLYWARTRRIDVGLLNGEPFACFVGFGFDAAVIENVPEKEKRYLKEWAFVAAGLRTLFGWNPEELRFRPYEPSELRVRGTDQDGRPVDLAGYFVAIGNVQDYGTRLFPFMQGASFDDGLLDVVVVRTRDLVELVNIGTQVLTRSHLRNPNVSSFRSSQTIHVEALGAPVPMHADAELVRKEVRSEIQVAPAALT
ncbi:MAG: diacylglycerol/lipid kinase family protein, partial [Candidatus Krumholzibacteriia bacterium]